VHISKIIKAFFYYFCFYLGDFTVKCVLRLFKKPIYRDSFLPNYLSFCLNLSDKKLLTFDDILTNREAFELAFNEEEGTCTFQNVVVFRGGIIIWQQYIVLKDRYGSYALARQYWNLMRAIALARHQELSMPAHLLTGSYDESFHIFHFLTDALIPNITNKVHTEEKIILSPSFDHPFSNELFQLLKIHNRQSIAKEGVQCSNLSVCLSRDKWHRTNYSSFRRSLFQACESKRYIKNENNSDEGNLIYVSRRFDRRGFSNEVELETLVKKLGFQVIDFSKISYSERASLLENTRVLVGQYGAGLTNMIFMKAGCVVDIQLGHWVKEDYCRLADMCELSYLNLPLPLTLFGSKTAPRLSANDLNRIKLVLYEAIEKVTKG
jgi:hypothetical protein